VSHGASLLWGSWGGVRVWLRTKASVVVDLVTCSWQAFCAAAGSGAFSTGKGLADWEANFIRFGGGGKALRFPPGVGRGGACRFRGSPRGVGRIVAARLAWVVLVVQE
jgi:hypothetical protein